MRLIIAGSRDMWIKVEELDEIICKLGIQDEISLVVWGGAEGIDECGKDWANHFGIHVEPFPADWTKYGDAAGPIRNKKMAVYGEALLLIWDGKSKGSANMRMNMKKLNKPVYEVVRGKDE